MWYRFEATHDNGKKWYCFVNSKVKVDALRILKMKFTRRANYKNTTRVSFPITEIEGDKVLMFYSPKHWLLYLRKKDKLPKYTSCSIFYNETDKDGSEMVENI